MTGIVPVNLLLGTLGSGKTTTVKALLKMAPRDETWVVIVNEFGVVGLDKAIMEQDAALQRFPIREVPGGCICCSAQADLKLVIREVMQAYQPDRLIIEPSGLSDAQALVREVKAVEEELGVVLESVIGHLDIRLFRNARILEVPFWKSFLAACTEIIATKVDLASKQQLHQFRECVSGSFPHESIHQGREDFLRDPWRNAQKKRMAETYLPDDDWLPLISKKAHAHEHASIQKGDFLDAQGTWYEAVSERFYCVGWIVGRKGCLSLQSLSDWIETLTCEASPILRLKGILRTDDGWRQVEMVNGRDLVMKRTRPRNDSRIELITLANDGDWSAFQRLWFEDPVVS